MKISQTSKVIDGILNPPGDYKRDKPNYIGRCTVWNEKRSQWDKVNSHFVARKYSHIIDLVQETKATVKITNQKIIISYCTGQATIGIDELVKEVLIPELKKITTIQ